MMLSSELSLSYSQKKIIKFLKCLPIGAQWEPFIEDSFKIYLI